MLNSAQDCQIAAFFGLVALFEILERIRPSREVNRWKDLKIDVLSFAIAVLVNRLSHFMVGKVARTVAPPVVVEAVARLQALPSGIKIALAILLVDFIIYWIHRAQHHFGPLWRTHVWHHSIEHLYWFSGFRTSFFHSFLYAIPAASIPILLFDLTPLEAGLGYSFGLFVQFWEHTNLKVNIGRLAWIFITPDYHRVHHSTEHSRSNFGTTFSFWDRMFGTYTDPATVPISAPLGLGEPIRQNQIPRMLIGV